MSEQISNQGTTANEALIQSALAQVNTAIPAIIKSFDSTNQTCEAQPTIKRQSNNGDVDYPLLVDVPVIFIGGGDFVITHPVNSGDECLIIFSQRCIDSWYATGEISSQFEPRSHDLSDGVAIVGLRSQKKAIGNFSSGAIEIRNKANNIKMSINDSGIEFTFGAFTLTLNASGITTNAPINSSAPISTTANSLSVGGVNMANHTHDYTDDGNPMTTQPPN